MKVDKIGINSNLKKVASNYFKDVFSTVKKVDDLVDKIDKGGKIDPQELSFAVVDANRKVEHISSISKIAISSYQEIMKIVQ